MLVLAMEFSRGSTKPAEGRCCVETDKRPRRRRGVACRVKER
jgi:hypothetical protein